MEPTKSTEVFCNPILGRWHISSWTCYLLMCAAISVVVRAFHSLCRAWAYKHGDVPKSDPDKIEGYWLIFWKCFIGFTFKRENDLWLPTFIGFAELAAYPVLLVAWQILIIGAWLGIKTAGAWRGWQTSRTSYNRFLFFNLVNLFIAYFLLARFVSYIPCPGHP
jgi:hypothetical protein